ncbi:MAG TPA: fused MFS/spermidine synthase [Ktedonobacterales bacterium]|nr:fused MFS/spermidine synthase [Ktedonobacterales bacterium]
MRLPFADRSARVAAGDSSLPASATPRADLAARVSDAPNRLSLLALVFIGGMASLALEMLGPRLMAPFFGTSLFIWANQIGFTLIYLSLGYYLGGRLADRRPSMRLLCGITAIAAIFTGLIPFISGPVLNAAAIALNGEIPNVFVGSLFTVVLLFSVPTILLGMVSPFAIRLTLSGVGSAGRAAGNLYALSTVGSIIGAFLPVLVLIPDLGVRRSFFLVSVVLLGVSLWGLRGAERIGAAIPGALLLLPLLLPQLVSLGPLKGVSGIGYGTVVDERESLYNFIQVVRGPDGSMNLLLNEGHAIHSMYLSGRTLNGPSWYTDYALAAPLFAADGGANSRPRLAVVGLAAGTVAKQYTAVYGPVPIDGVEIDPSIIAVGRQYFAMNEPNLHVTVADGRTFMRFSHDTYDVVMVDAYKPPYIPFQLTTTEFFQEARAHMAADGVIVLNTSHVGADYRLVHAFVNTLRQVFPSVYTVDVPDSLNTEIFATVQPTTLGAIQAHLAAAAQSTTTSPALATVASETEPLAQVAHAQPGGIVFTDDQAPVEQISDQLIIDYIQH